LLSNWNAGRRKIVATSFHSIPYQTTVIHHFPGIKARPSNRFVEAAPADHRWAIVMTKAFSKPGVR